MKLNFLVVCAVSVVGASFAFAGGSSNGGKNPNVGRYKATQWVVTSGPMTGVLLAEYVVTDCVGSPPHWSVGSASTTGGTARQIDVGCGTSNEN